jgi:thiol:disulfide interchange protein DsbC
MNMSPQTRMNALLTKLLLLSCVPGFALAQNVQSDSTQFEETIRSKSDAVDASVIDSGGLARRNDLVAVQRNLRLMYPKTRFGMISATPLPGIYEVEMGRNVAFVEESGRYFIFGRMFDMEKQEDITSGAAAAQPASPAVDFASLPLQHAIKSVHGQGRRALVVFSDPDCPYCKKLEQELAKVDDVTVYTFLMPLEQLHPDSRAKADAVWCSKDRSAAWSALMLNGKVPKKTKGCEAPHQAVLPLAEKFGINGTPFLVAGDGRTMPGAAAAARISTWLDAVKKPAAANVRGDTQ